MMLYINGVTRDSNIFNAKFPHSMSHKGPVRMEDIEELRRREFGHAANDVYLDHAGATLYSASQVRHMHDLLCAGVHGNPHSSDDGHIDAVRARVLRHFGTTPEDYSVVFTSGATAALKLVGECFQWSPRGAMCHLVDNHTSALGIRHYAQLGGSDICAVTPDLACACDTERVRACVQISGPSLFVVPAESNFCGRRYDLARLCSSQSFGHLGLVPHMYTLVDAAKFCASSPLSLAQHPVDFVAVSFYKMFGLPTGLGCLLVRNRSAHVLHKRFPGGGTVDVILPDRNVFVPSSRSIAARYEDGTLPFLGIRCITHGLDLLERLSMDRIRTHVGRVTDYALGRLRGLVHASGLPVCTIYGHDAVDAEFGPVIAFNIRTRTGTGFYGCAVVALLAAVSRIWLRAGVMCNPGACNAYLGIDSRTRMRQYAAGVYACGRPRGDVDPMGAVRASFGYMSAHGDADRLVEFLDRTFVSPPPRAHVSGLFVYPVKSCGPMVTRCLERLLPMDRHWLVADADTQAPISLKRDPRIGMIWPVVDLDAATLTLTHGIDAHRVPITACPDDGCAYRGNAATTQWLTRVLRRPSYLSCSLCANGTRRATNRGNLLLVNTSSVARIRDAACPEEPLCTSIMRFRPNIVITGTPAFREMSWSAVCISGTEFPVRDHCQRCTTVDIDPNGSGERRPFLESLRQANRRHQLQSAVMGILI